MHVHSVDCVMNSNFSKHMSDKCKSISCIYELKYIITQFLVLVTRIRHVVHKCSYIVIQFVECSVNCLM